MNSGNTKFSLSAIYMIVFLESKKTKINSKNNQKQKKKKKKVSKLEYKHQIKLRI